MNIQGNGSTLHLILGGARSGKSRYAQQLARQAELGGARIVCIVTALAGDDEMAERIARHRAERPPHWVVREVPPGVDGLAAAMREEAREGCFVVVDCLTLWLSQLMCPPPGVAAVDAQAATQALLAALHQVSTPVVLVSNEIGAGVMPMDAATRRVIDALGRLHQQMAALAGRVTWVVAGLPMTVKDV